MRIDEGQRILIEQQGKLNKSQNSETGSFQQIMEQLTSRPETGRALPLNINPVQIINGPAGIIPMTGQSDSNEKAMLLDSLKGTLDLIDFYTGKLADTSLPAEDLSSLVDQLDEKLADIKGISSMEGIPDKLKPVISDIAVTMGAEIERFRRGDYL
ncbi:MAG: hypothetical protein JW927_03455 [Deltaproteobacteria bacterium]|nr:hypothetical protein [Deltaproteobacteria bacterium]